MCSLPQAPEICALYTLPVSEKYVRQAIRRQFEENRHVTDLKAIDQLVLRGRQEYQETINFWKQRDHVLGKLLAPRGRPPRTFLEKFYEGVLSSGFTCYLTDPFAVGRDEDQVLPAATGTLVPTP